MSNASSSAEGGAMGQATAKRGLWSSRLAFILAATGSAVGLGNIWKFPTSPVKTAVVPLFWFICCALRQWAYRS